MRRGIQRRRVLQQMIEQCKSKSFDPLSVIERIKPVLAARGFVFQDDGKVACPQRNPRHSLWIYFGNSPNRRCDLWHHVYFQYFDFIPSACHECWKVTIRPSTIAELFRLYELQKRMNRPSKCGIDRRLYTHGLYAGFLYCDGFDHGKETYAAAISSIAGEISSGTPVTLKKGCTEFEMRHGPSLEWSVTEEQLRIETVLDKVFISNPRRNTASESLIRHIHMEWIKWAYAWGDSTYRELTNGKDLYPELTTYHAHSTK